MDNQQQIQERAYALWIEDGCIDGRADDHWFRAERELRDVAKITPIAGSEPRAEPRRRPVKRRSPGKRAA